MVVELTPILLGTAWPRARPPLTSSTAIVAMARALFMNHFFSGAGADVAGKPFIAMILVGVSIMARNPLQPRFRWQHAVIGAHGGARGHHRSIFARHETFGI